MDADDICEPDRLKEQVQFMNANPDIDVLGTGALYYINGFNNKGIQINMPETHDQIIKTIYKKTPFIHPSVVMRKKFLIEMNGYALSVGYKNIEDWDLWVRGHKIFKYHNLQRQLIKHNARQTMTWTEFNNRFKGAIKVLIRDKKIQSYGLYHLALGFSVLLSKAKLYTPRIYK